jgi:transcription antitermination factor NusG
MTSRLVLHVKQPEFFVVQTNPQREAFVAERLTPLDPYLPQIKTGKGRIAPLFPGYLFVPAIAHWSPIKNCIGVRTLLMTGENPARISGSVVSHWKARERGGFVQLPPPPRFQKGARLTITKGTLRYKTGVYIGMSGKDREKVLIEMLGQQVLLTIATADLVVEQPSRDRRHLHRYPKTA